MGAARHPSSFYRGANFNDADLRGQDLRGFNLDAATFERARVDRNTKTDQKYNEHAGLKRERIELGAVQIVLSALLDNKIILEYPKESHLGDIIEESIFLYKKNKLQIPFGKENFSENLIWGKSFFNEIDIKSKNRKKLYSSDPSLGDKLTHQIIKGASDFLKKEKIYKPDISNILNADVTSQTISNIYEITDGTIPIGRFSSVLLIAHISRGNRKTRHYYQDAIAELLTALR